MPKLRIGKRASRELADLAPDIGRTIIETLRAFAARELVNADIKKLQGRHPPEYRLRVGKFRVIYVLENQDIVILHILDRKDAYR